MGFWKKNGENEVKWGSFKTIMVSFHVVSFPLSQNGQLTLDKYCQIVFSSI